MQLIKREGLIGRVALGLFAGVISILFFNIDQIGAIELIHAGNSALNYSVLIVMLYILFVMNFIAGIRREYEASITYIISMILFDILTNGLATLLFAGISFISFLVGLLASNIIKRLDLNEG